MLFNSFAFLFIFFPLVMFIYWGCSHLNKGQLQGEAAAQEKETAFETQSVRKRERGFLTGLLLLSLVFYGWLYPFCIPFLLYSMAVNFGLASTMERQSVQVQKKESAPAQEKKQLHKKQILTIGFVLNVAALFLFKYFHLTAPGISFFTFSQIAYLTEVYRGNLKKVPILEYGLYISFFPKLIQGPIALPEEMLEQFHKFRLKTDWERIFRGTFLFVLGLFQKVVIADTLGGAVDFGYASPSSLNSGEALIVVLSYTLQLYFDFSGYCDMAMGIGNILGITLPVNFRLPYQAADIMEFWDRWHITLTRFFTRYLYIPLGGSRKGRGRTYCNILIVFLVSGIWHGLGLQFVIWGMMHGVLNVLTRVFREWKEKRGMTRQLPRAVGVFFTFLYVNAAWVFFRAPSVADAFAMFRSIFRFQFGRVNKNLAACFNLEEFWYVIKLLRLDGWQYGQYILMVVILVLLLLLVFRGRTAAEYAGKAKPGIRSVAVMAVLFVWSVLSLSGVSSFLYFNF